MKSVVIWGAQGTGKSTNAQALMIYYGLSRVVDEWYQDRQVPLQP